MDSKMMESFREVKDHSFPDKRFLGEGFLDRMKDSISGKEPHDSAVWVRALKTQHLEMIQDIVEHTDVDVNAPVEIEGGKELPLIIVMTNTTILKYLLEHGADPNAYDPKSPSYSPVVEAVLGNHPNSLSVLLDYGGNPNSYITYDVPIFGQVEKMPLISIASYHGYTKVMEMLLEAGADPFAFDETSREPLIYAVLGNSEGAVRVLKDYKAHLKMNRDLTGRNALDYAYELKNYSIMNVISRGSASDYKNRSD